MKYHIAICDDEKLALKINAVVIEEIAEKMKLDITIGCFQDGSSLIEYADKTDVDLAFLDINFKEKEFGIQLAKQLRDRNPAVAIIFITGELVSPVEVFRVKAFGYIQKPLDLNAVQIDLQRAVRQVNLEKSHKISEPLLITEDNLKKKIRQTHIIYIVKEQARSKIVMKNSIHFVYETIKFLIGRLDSNFMQISQSVIVNLDLVDVCKKIWCV